MEGVYQDLGFRFCWCLQPGEEAEKLQGGVAGGSISEGLLKVGDEIEIRPGIITKDASGFIQCR